MRIEHLAFWSKDIERLKTFYAKYFDAKAAPIYENPKKHFISYFLNFDSGPRLEVMQKESLQDGEPPGTQQVIGYAHFSLAVGSKEAVDTLTARLLVDGVAVVSAPRWTGDGYYESVILDPDGNSVEITI